MNNIEDGAKLKASDLQTWIKKVDRLKALAKSFGDDDAIEQLKLQIERIQLLYRALTGDNSLANKGAHSSTE